MARVGGNASRLLAVALLLSACGARLPRANDPHRQLWPRASVGFYALAEIDAPNVACNRSTVAEDAAELDELWRFYGVPGRPPRVDFNTFVVIGVVKPYACPYRRTSPGPIKSLRVYADGRIVPELYGVSGMCEDVGSFGPCEGVAQLLAVRRDRLPPHFEVELDRKLAYDIQSSASGPRSRAMAAAQWTRRVAGFATPATGDTLTLPAAPGVSVATLDRAPFFVVQRPDGSVQLLAASHPSVHMNELGLPSELWLSLGYDCRARQFISAATRFDARGFAFDAREQPLEEYAAEIVSREPLRIKVGRRQARAKQPATLASSQALPRQPECEFLEAYDVMDTTEEGYCYGDGKAPRHCAPSPLVSGYTLPLYSESDSTGLHYPNQNGKLYLVANLNGGVVVMHTFAADKAPPGATWRPLPSWRTELTLGPTVFGSSGGALVGFEASLAERVRLKHPFGGQPRPYLGHDAGLALHLRGFRELAESRTDWLLLVGAEAFMERYPQRHHRFTYPHWASLLMPEVGAAVSPNDLALELTWSAPFSYRNQYQWHRKPPYALSDRLGLQLTPTFTWLPSSSQARFLAGASLSAIWW